jgi:hypothetical protein
MQELTLKIPDNKLSFFMELIKSLGFVQIEQEVLTPHQKEQVNQERKLVKENPHFMLDWDDAQKLLKVE